MREVDPRAILDKAAARLVRVRRSTICRVYLSIPPQGWSLLAHLHPVGHSLVGAALVFPHSHSHVSMPPPLPFSLGYLMFQPTVYAFLRVVPYLTGLQPKDLQPHARSVQDVSTPDSAYGNLVPKISVYTPSAHRISAKAQRARMT